MGAFFHAVTQSRSGQATGGEDAGKKGRGEWSDACCQLANGILYTVKYLK